MKTDTHECVSPYKHKEQKRQKYENVSMLLKAKKYTEKREIYIRQKSISGCT